MRVLVTGAGGFVGSHVVEALLTQTKHDVIALDSFRHSGTVDKLASALDAAGTPNHRVTTAVHDLRAPFSATQYAQLGQIDAVSSIASRCHVGESLAEPVDFVRNNVDLVLNVLELAREKGARVLHLSTDEVYGPLRPASPGDHAPSSPYAASKAAQEDICHAYRRAYGVPLTIVNSANMFGERQSQLAFIPRIVRALLRGEKLQVHYHRGSPGVRGYTYVRNVAAEIASLLSTDSAPRRAVLPGQQRVTNIALALRVADLLGKKLDYEVVDAESVRPGYDPEYAWLEEYTWAPDIEFEEGLDRTVRWFAGNPESLER